MKYIGIDPDIEKSGFAVYDTQKKTLGLTTCSFTELMNAFATFDKDTTIIVVEASWQATHNWHLSGKDNVRIASRKGYYVGANHQTGKLIAEVARSLGFEVIEQRPLKKCWHGKDGKITAHEFANLTGYVKRTNQEMRDAALLALHSANVPLRLKRK